MSSIGRILNVCFVFDLIDLLFREEQYAFDDESSGDEIELTAFVAFLFSRARRQRSRRSPPLSHSLSSTLSMNLL